MTVKDILVHLDASDGSIARLRLAIDLAQRHTSRLSALFVDEWSLEQHESRATAELGLAAAHDLVLLDRSIGADIERSATRLRTLLATAHSAQGLEFEWLRSAGSSAAAIARLAPYCDLCILGHDSFSTGTSVDSEFCERLVFSTVTPIVFVPTRTKVTSLGRRIVVAWDASRAAARALHDALALIEHAEWTTVLSVNRTQQIDSDGSVDLVQQRLRRHSAQVEAIEIPAVAAESIAVTLQTKAVELGADLLVAGAFGHSRLKERIFGGVSRELLRNMALPVLMSH